ncbi:protein CDV3 homolog [Drosophila sulfurigaster albostrigata]|uniref:protein CDV3 homolog n=1 Tax=Drosophila sulfurigaster albostrigata TaxID=89887 RepID=UPI002D21AA81|nr:protein CDV3 homolog [Drosophila sulfurigaster albostrigata]
MKTNLLATDVLYRTLEETAKVPPEMDNNEKLPLEAMNSTRASLEFGIRFPNDAVDEEDEWCDFTEDHDQPFPNLTRNSKLLLSPTAPVTTEDVKVSNEHSQYQDTGGDGLGVGSSTEDSGKTACPWLRVEPNEISSCGTTIVESVERKSHPLIAAQPDIMVKKSVYVPPALRASQIDMKVRPKKPTTPSAAVKLSKGQAPDINNVEYFPSLSPSHISKRAK